MDLLWKQVVHIFPILNKQLTEMDCSNVALNGIMNEIVQLGIAEDIYETVFLEIGSILRQQIAPQFWKNFREKSDQNGDINHFQYAVEELHANYMKFQLILKRLEVLRLAGNFKNLSNRQNEVEKFNHLFKGTLLSQLPIFFGDIVFTFYNISFRVFANSHAHEVSDPEDLPELDDLKCNGCQLESEQCRCQELITAFNVTNKNLIEMDLLDRLAENTLTSLIQERIETSVRDMCKGVFVTSNIKKLEKWLDRIVINWLVRSYNFGSLKIDENNTKMQTALKDFKIKLSCFLYETYAYVIIDQFFDIIIEFPDSQPAIDDLKICLVKLDLRPHLIKTLKTALETRLLHPGVDTSDILTGYVAAIKSLRHLDSSGVLLETITEPVKEYLRSRADTVRCVVTGLIEDGPTDLAEELAKSEALKEDVSIATDEISNWEAWNPDPVDANPVKATKRSRSADIISMVVDIYGSKELFVNEYKNLLAERLLLQLDLNPEKEIRNLELLKLRFGETVLHSCEVMLKDISDSKRINTHIQGDSNYCEEKTFDFSSLILSSQFWPSFKKETLELPEYVKTQFDNYTKSYEAHKGNRTLCWRPLSGKVNIEVQLSNKKLDLTVTPTQATIIMNFQEREEWTLIELGNVMKIPPAILRMKIAFWQSQGIIKETKNDTFILIEETNQSDIEEMQTQTQDLCDDDDEAENAMASASDQREEELQVFWSYIVGMLTNLDSLPLERIHQMLKMFASHGPGVEFSQEELKNFLQRKVREHKLIFAAGVYHLPK